MKDETDTSAGVDRRRLPIGVFDSGVGGLTVVAALQRRLPNEHLLYLGDTARLPYGTKSADTVRRYARNAAQVLVDRGVKMLVIACNTASAVALDDLVAAFAPLPTIGVVEPGAVAAVSATRTGRILVLGTEGTVRGGAYPRAIAAVHEKVLGAGQVDDAGRAAAGGAPALPRELKVWGQACPLFVTLAEEGWLEGEIPEAVARRYLGEHLSTLAGRARGSSTPPGQNVDFDTLVLGCTHFPMLSAALRNVVGPEVAIVDSAETTADVVAEALGTLDLLHPSSSPTSSSATGTDRPTDHPTEPPTDLSSRASPLADTAAHDALRGEHGPARGLVVGHGTGAASGLVGVTVVAERAGARARLVLMATDAPERFARVGSVFLGRTLSADDVTLVDL